LALRGIDRTALEPALAALGQSGVSRLDRGTPLEIAVDPRVDISAEGYRLSAHSGRIAIRAADAAGAANALRSLTQQVTFEKGALRPIVVEDRPRYGFRGLHLDLGRNFHDKAEILKVLDAMAAYKLNRLHLHLAEDEGWRLEVRSLPELTDIGSRRCHDPSERQCLLPQLGAGPDGGTAVNGYLSHEDYVEIVRAAGQRHIEVIPSIDMPGHSRAAIRAMEARHERLSNAGDTAGAERYRLIDPLDRTKYRSIQNYTDNTLNVCLPSTYAFVDTVVDALVGMHREAGQRLRTFHLGADETAGAWVDSPACKPMLASGLQPKSLTPMFIERVAALLAKKGLRTAGWSDGMGHTKASNMPRNSQTNIWGTLFTGAVLEAHEQANRGWDVVLSVPDLGYFDMPYAPHPQEGGYDWASRGVSTYQVYAFMPGNLPANAALIRNIKAKYEAIADPHPLAAGRSFAGVQAQLWSETVRTDAGLEYMLFPRLLALAERGWSPAPWEPPYSPGATYAWNDPRVNHTALAAGWRDFSGRLAAQLPALDRMGIRYRVDPPGARVSNGLLHANSILPGTAIEYRVQGGAWQPYSGPVPVKAAVELRSRSSDGRRASRIVTAEQ
jgi:hexosaminidase